MHERTNGGTRAAGRNFLELLAGCGLHPLERAPMTATEPSTRPEQRAAPAPHYGRIPTKQVA